VDLSLIQSQSVRGRLLLHLTNLLCEPLSFSSLFYELATSQVVAYVTEPSTLTRIAVARLPTPDTLTPGSANAEVKAAPSLNTKASSSSVAIEPDNFPKNGGSS
jgi:hypothetical protein